MSSAGQTTGLDAGSTVSQPRASFSDYLYDPSVAARSNRIASVDGTKPAIPQDSSVLAILRASQNWVSSLIAISSASSDLPSKTFCICDLPHIGAAKNIRAQILPMMQNEVEQRFFGKGAMSSKPDRTPTSVQAAPVSLVALVACALASDAHASRLPVEPGVAHGGLSARVGRIIERVRAGEPTLLPQLPPEPKMAWRN